MGLEEFLDVVVHVVLQPPALHLHRLVLLPQSGHVALVLPRQPAQADGDLLVFPGQDRQLGQTGLVADGQAAALQAPGRLLLDQLGQPGPVVLVELVEPSGESGVALEPTNRLTNILTVIVLYLVLHI